jgi:hypothetical protein
VEQVDSELIDQYFRQLFEAGWVGVETLLTKHQIENDVTRGFVHGIFVATALACIEDDHVSEGPNIVERREVLYKNLGGLQGLIGELIKRMEFDWKYVPIDQRTQEDWQSPNLSLIKSG